MSRAEDILRAVEETVGYSFADRSLLQAALTHPSYAAEHAGAQDYERLEFLGDAVLGLIVAEALYQALPESNEGDLTRRKIAAVSGARLSRSAEELGLSDAIALGHGEGAHGRRARSILENVVEALIGAAYLDGGLAAARTVVFRLLGDLATPFEPPRDSKSALQEYTQAHGLGLPEYRVVDSSGPPHDPRFAVEVFVAGRLVARGSGRSKQQAEKAAASAALDAFDPPEGRR